MPAFVEGHRHLVTGDAAQWLTQRAAPQFQQFLEAGFTTVSRGDRSATGRRSPQANRSRSNERTATLCRNIPTGGGRNRPSTQWRPGSNRSRTRSLANDTRTRVARDATIKAVESAKQTGYDYLKVVLNTTQNGPEVETLKLIVAEGKKHNMPTIVHAVSVRDTLAALEAKPDMLVHTPHIGSLGDDPAAVKKIVDAKIPMTSTLAVFVPHFDTNGAALFRMDNRFPGRHSRVRDRDL
jgi:imidazolonepropionase-like amidohydrolase